VLFSPKDNHGGIPMTIIDAKWPEFKLLDEQGRPWTLDDLLGQWTLIYFYPKDNTSGCTQQACEMNSQQASWQNIGLQILGVSCDSATSHQKFKSRFQLGFPLLVDENSELMKQLGLWKQKSMYGRTYWGAIRSAFLLNKDARIVWSEQNIKLSGHLERLQAAIHTFVESKK
jgi:peroxiredoxin Q/BCP